MKNLTRKEEMIMLAVLNLGKKAYLVAITDYLSKIIGKEIGLTSVHLPLSRLEKRGWITAVMGEATPVRGGRRKKIYAITPDGFSVLEDYKRISDRIWEKYAEGRFRSIL